MATALAVFVTSAPQCVAPPPGSAAYSHDLVPMFGALTFEKPIEAVPHPTESDTWFVVVHRGLVELVRDGRATTVLDITDRVAFGREHGLSSIALHPNFPRDGRLFAAYSVEGPAAQVSVFELDAGGETFDPESEAILLTESAPFPWHGIGRVAFGPDGLLYVAWGDGQAPRADSLRGKILRIDVDGDPYTIPPDNPFTDGRFPHESYAVGLRMPWRFSFDRLTGALWVGDVGAHAYEEINRVVAGGDYGWPVWEGSACAAPDACAATPAEPPFFEHGTTDLCAIIGGHVYRGRKFPDLYGHYIYGDSCTGTIRALDLDADPPESRMIARTPVGIGSFAEDRDGELYVVETRRQSVNVSMPRSGFRVLALEQAAEDARPASPAGGELLSSTGCVARAGFRHAPPGLIAYGINQPAWADGATAYRFTTLLPMLPVWGLDVDLLSRAPGSIMIKTFVLGERPVETQMLVRRRDGRWDAFDYRWNPDGRDAVAVSGPTDVSLPDGVVWRLPGPQQCSQCHADVIGSLRAVSAPQLNRMFEGRDQVDRLEALGTIVWPWKGGPIARLPAIDDDNASLDDRARAYLEVNCAHCHQPAGQAGNTRMDLRRATPLALSGLCDKRPNVVLPGHENTLLLVPGEPERSLLYLRMLRSDSAAMPPNRRVVDDSGTALVEAWIRSLDSCAPPALAASVSGT